jgi:hypothetical protein
MASPDLLRVLCHSYRCCSVSVLDLACVHDERPLNIFRHVHSFTFGLWALFTELLCASLLTVPLPIDCMPPC